MEHQSPTAGFTVSIRLAHHDLHFDEIQVEIALARWGHLRDDCSRELPPIKAHRKRGRANVSLTAVFVPGY